MDILENYRITEKSLGEGAFGKVKLGFDKKNLRNVAIKIVPIKKLKQIKNNSSKILYEDDNETIHSKKEMIEKEIEIFKCLDHPHIVKYYDCIYINNVYYICMEYIKHGNMFDYVTNSK